MEVLYHIPASLRRGVFNTESQRHGDTEAERCALVLTQRTLSGEDAKTAKAFEVFCACKAAEGTENFSDRIYKIYRIAPTP